MHRFWEKLISIMTVWKLIATQVLTYTTPNVE